MPQGLFLFPALLSPALPWLACPCPGQLQSRPAPPPTPRRPQVRTEVEAKKKEVMDKQVGSSASCVFCVILDAFLGL